TRGAGGAPPASSPTGSRRGARGSAPPAGASVTGRGGERPRAGLMEFGDLPLEQEEAVHERVGRGGTAGHVDVHRHDAVHALDDVVPVAEGSPRVRARAP